MRNKIILSILILSIIALVFSGCGGTTTPTIPSDSLVAVITSSTTSGEAPLEVTSDASESSSAEGNKIISYQWDFKDGNTGNGETINHTFSSTGSYNVELTVTDNKGATDSATKTITVTEPITDLENDIENEYFVIKYQLGYEEDASKTLDSAMWVREHTMKKYLHDLGVKVTIYVYNSREEIMAEEGVPTAIAHSSYDGQNYTASIGILRPSWEGHWGGYEELDNPFRRVLNHEYVHSVFYKDLFMKSTGYKDTPSWFDQGIDEYISENYCPSYEKRVREAVQSGSFMIDEPYSWGLYILEYMYKEYGQVKVVSLIRSTAPTFLDALRKNWE